VVGRLAIFFSCLSAAPLSQLLPQWGEGCLQVPEISSVANWLSFFGVGFLLCWFIGGLFLCLVPFFWGQVRDLSASSLLSVYYAGLLTVFQFCSIVWLWMLLTSSGDELCGLLFALFQAAAYHLPTVSPSAFPVFVYWKFAWRSAPCLSPRLQCAQSTPPPLLRVAFQLLVYCSVVFFFLQDGGQSFQGAMLVYASGSCGNTTCRLFAHLLVCVSQAALELASGGTGALLFSQCNVAWRTFVQTGGSGCWSFASSWWVFSAKCGSSISAKFLIYRAHAVYFCPLVAILDPCSS
jgi:hypothetical protein